MARGTQTVTAVGAALILLAASFTVAASPASAEGQTCLGKAVTITGTEGDDEIVTTADQDVILALGGDDTVHAKGGDDYVCAGEGADVVKGGGGYDEIDGGSGEDSLYGGKKAGYFHPGAGDDYVHGGQEHGYDRHPSWDYVIYNDLDEVRVDLAAGYAR